MRTPLVALLCAAACAGAPAAPPPASRYEDLVQLFGEWRQLQRPRESSGIPDYTPAAIEAQKQGLADLRRRLDAFDTRGWTMTQQDDLEIVRAEMNGLDFDHRVLRPWERDPAFYVTVFDEQSDQPAREGPHAAGAIELWSMDWPLADEQARALEAGLARIPPLLDEARGNLRGNARDLWTSGIAALQAQKALLESFGVSSFRSISPAKDSEKARTTLATLTAAAQRAATATASFVSWLEAQAPSKNGPSGIGVENYDWYLANVQLVPYTWAQEVALMERELARANATLALEEQKNRAVPQPEPVGSDWYDMKFNAAVSEYVNFLRTHQIVTVKDWMEPALRAHIGHFTPGRREFFTEVDVRDPVIMRTHGYHWIDLAMLEREPPQDPIRRGPLLYNIFNTRTEGFATAMEELMMHEGLFDARPHSRELIYVLLAERAARALGELRMHANQSTLSEAAKFAAANTPRGWLRLGQHTVHEEQHLYLEQPGYGTSYLVGKIQVDALIADRARQIGEGFTLRQVLDPMNAAGMIPITLVRRELSAQAP